MRLNLFKLTFINVALIEYCIAFRPSQSANRKGINNGRFTKLGEIKYAVAILDTNFQGLCSGSIIGESHVLSAAHCYVDEKTNAFLADTFEVYAGTNDLLKSKPKLVKVGVAKIYIPESFNAMYNYGDADIAVLKLKEPLSLTLNERLEALPLPTNPSQPGESDRYKDVIGSVAGFGKNMRDPKYISKYKLYKMSVEVLEDSTCKDLSKYESPNVICAKPIDIYDNLARGVCDGDSGAPLVDLSNGVVIGVVSTSFDDCDDRFRPGVYTKVSAYLDFVNDAMVDRQIDMRVLTA